MTLKELIRNTSIKVASFLAHFIKQSFFGVRRNVSFFCGCRYWRRKSMRHKSDRRRKWLPVLNCSSIKGIETVTSRGRGARWVVLPGSTARWRPKASRDLDIFAGQRRDKRREKRGVGVPLDTVIVPVMRGHRIPSAIVLLMKGICLCSTRWWMLWQISLFTVRVAALPLPWINVLYCECLDARFKHDASLEQCHSLAFNTLHISSATYVFLPIQ